MLEGIALGHKVHVEKLLSARPAPEAVRLAGGAARSPLWAQMFADVLELPVEIVETEELGTLGCAMAAAVATGEFPDLKAAAREMVHVRARIHPDPASSRAYRGKFALHKAVSAALDGTWGLFGDGLNTAGYFEKPGWGSAPSGPGQGPAPAPICMHEERRISVGLMTVL